MKVKSLKTNILISLILFAIIPLVLLSTVILYEMYIAKKEAIFEKHKTILKQVIDEADGIIDDIEYIGEYVKDRYPTKKKMLLRDLTRIKKNIKTILILDNNGILRDFVSHENLNIYKGFDYSNTDYFEAIKNGKDRYWTDIFLSQATGKVSIAYSLRVDKNTISVLFIDLDFLNNFAKKFKTLDGFSSVRIVDKSGIFIAHPDSVKFVQQRKTIHNTTIYKYIASKTMINKQIIFKNKTDTLNIGVYGITNKAKWVIIVRERYDLLFKRFNMLVFYTILFIIMLTIISILFALRLSSSILEPLYVINEKIEKIANGEEIKDIKQLNYKELDNLIKNVLTMQTKIKQREKENRKKDMQLFETSKLAQMGEMIGNIAHQWRQPLSIISTAASGMRLKKEYDMLNDDEFYQNCDIITKNTQYLSKTIDTFREFTKENKILKDTTIQKLLKDTIDIVEATLKNNHIRLIDNIDYNKKLIIKIVPDELSQVVINILNNAKDILVEKKVENKIIKIECYNDNENLTITIEDNGGGVPDNIIGKIFDPYFTTKHKTQGTGLGLHMSYRIVKDSLGGKLYVENTNIGAKFFIKIPIKQH